MTSSWSEIEKWRLRESNSRSRLSLVKTNFALLLLAGGTVALLCMSRTQRVPLDSDTGDSRPPELSWSKETLHRAAPRRFEARIPVKLNELESLAADDSSAGIEALEQFLSGTDELAWVAAFAWLIDQPAAAASWIESLPDGPLRNVIIDRVLSERAHRNPAGALATADSLTTPDLRDAALTSVLRRWASDSPVEALSAIVAREEWRDSPLVGRAFVAAAASFPRQIKELLAIIPSESLDSSFLATAAESLLAKDPGAISLWFESAQTAQQRSAIAETVMLHAGRNRPDLAFIWATQLPDSNQRADALRHLMHKTAQRNPDAASALFDTPWLSSEDRDELLNWFARKDAPQ